MVSKVSALNGATFKGFATITEQGLRGMITLRGDVSSAKVKSAVKKVMGTAVPATGQIVGDGDTRTAWMSPDELLLLVPYKDADATVAALTQALGTQHSLVVNVSDARAVFQVKGKPMRDVIAKITPADMSSEVLSIGDMRRTRLAQVPAAFYLVDDTTLELVCFRSVAGYVFDLLSRSAAKGGEVGYHA